MTDGQDNRSRAERRFDKRREEAGLDRPPPAREPKRQNPHASRLIGGIVLLLAAVAVGSAGAELWVSLLLGGSGVYLLVVAAVSQGVREGRSEN